MNKLTLNIIYKSGCICKLYFTLNVQVLEWLIRLVCKTNDESPRRFESDPELNKNALVVKWYHNGLQNYCSRFESLLACKILL